MTDEVQNAHARKKKKNLVVRIFTGRLFLISLAVLLIYTLMGFFLLPYVLKRQLKQYVQEDLNRKVQIADIRFNPYIMTLDISGLNLKEADGEPLLGFERFFADFELKSLFRWAWTFSNIRLEGLALRVDIAPDKTLNLGNLAADVSKSDEGAQPEKPGAHSPPPGIRLEHIQLVNGRVDISDRSLAEPARVMIEPINLDIRDLTTVPNDKAPHRIVAELPEGGRMEWRGKLSLRPLWSKGEFKLKNIRAPVLWDFVKGALKLEKPDGVLALSGNYLVDYVSRAPRVKVSDLSMALDNLSLKVKDTPKAVFDLKTIRMEGGRFDLAQREMTADRLDFADGNLRAVVENDGRLNWENILAAAPSGRSPENKGALKNNDPSFKIRLQNVALNNLGVRFEDHSRRHPIRMNLESLGINLKAEAQLSGKDPEAVLSGVNVDLKGLTIHQMNEPETLMSFPRTAVHGGKMDFGNHRMFVEEVVLNGGHAAIWRTPQGAVNLIALFSSENEGAIRRKITKAEQKAKAEAKPWSFQVARMGMKDFGLGLSDRGLKTPERYHLKNINLEVTDFKKPFKKPFQFDLDLRMAEGGKIAAKGSVDLGALKARLSVNAGKVPLQPLGPYLREFVTLSLDSGTASVKGNVVYGKNEKGADGLGFEGGAGIENLVLTRGGSETKFLSWHSLNLKGIGFNTAPKKLQIEQVRFKAPVGRLIIKKDGRLNVTEVLVHRGDKGKGAKPPANEKQTDEKQSDGKQTTAGTSGFPLSVNRVGIENAELDFADHTLKIPFSTTIHDLGGTIDGLSSSPDRKAVMALKGRVNQYGSARIKGELVPSNAREYSDITMIFRNIEMTRLTPYTAQFAGRKIQSGKISLDLNYKIVDSRLKGENQVIVDSLKLGEHVESPEAKNLPLDLAVALLKDAHGRIQLGLPVSGSLDNPEFSYGGLIWKALVNVLGKLVTSPFRALASLVGADEKDFGTVFFEPGRWRITPPQAEKLAKLAKAVKQRPQLVVEIEGRYAPDADGAVLKRLAVRRALAESMGRTDVRESTFETDPLNTTDPKTQKAVEKMALKRLAPSRLDALKKAHGLKPPPAAESPQKSGKKPPAEKAPAAPEADRAGYVKALFQEMVKNEPVTEEALESLARKRAEAAASELTARDRMDKAHLKTMKETEETAVQDGMVPISMALTAKAE